MLHVILFTMTVSNTV